MLVLNGIIWIVRTVGTAGREGIVSILWIIDIEVIIRIMGQLGQRGEYKAGNHRDNNRDCMDFYWTDRIKTTKVVIRVGQRDERDTV